MIVSGISSGVSLQAKPIIMPWSPAPIAFDLVVGHLAFALLPAPRSTPCAMSRDCSLIDTITPQVSASKPYLPRV